MREEPCASCSASSQTSIDPLAGSEFGSSNGFDVVFVDVGAGLELDHEVAGARWAGFRGRAGQVAGQHGDAAVARIETLTAPCDAEWVTSLIVCAADAHRALAELLCATDRTDAAADHARRALALDEAKANRAAATATRRRFAQILGAGEAHPGVQTQEGVKSSSYTVD